VSSARSARGGDPPSPPDRVGHPAAAGDLSTNDARRIADALVLRHASAPPTATRAPEIQTLVTTDFNALTRIERDTPELATTELRDAQRHQAAWLEKQEDRLEPRRAAGRIQDTVVSLTLDEVRLEPDREVQISVRRKGEPGDICVELVGLSVQLLVAGRVDAAEALIAHYAGQANDFDLYEWLNYYEFSTADSTAGRDRPCQ